MMLKSEKTG